MSEDTANASSRRDVLKATGAAAAGAAAFFAAASALGDEAGAVVDAKGVTHIPTSIKMTVDGVAVGKVRSVGPLTRNINVVRTVDSSGVRRFTRGDESDSDAVVVRDYDSSTLFRDWFAGDSSTGATTQSARQVELTLLGRRGSTIGTLSLVNAWPKNWSGPQWNTPQKTAAKFNESVTLVFDAWKLS